MVKRLQEHVKYTIFIKVGLKSLHINCKFLQPNKKTLLCLEAHVTPRALKHTPLARFLILCCLGGAVPTPRLWSELLELCKQIKGGFPLMLVVADSCAHHQQI